MLDISTCRCQARIEPFWRTVQQRIVAIETREGTTWGKYTHVLKYGASSFEKNVIAFPGRPARPVRPILWM
jgi:hypothetical protein